MVRVRVLFLEPGDVAYASEIEAGISLPAAQCGKMMHAEDYQEDGFYKVSASHLGESLQHGEMVLGGTMASSPNDPVIEMILPLTVVYFDLLEVNADWADGGGVGYDIECVGLFDVFHEYVADFIEHARLRLDKPNVHRDEFGTKVQFLTMWSYWSSQDYWGEWDCGVDFVGVFDRGDIKTRPLLDTPLVAIPDALVRLGEIEAII